MKKTGILLLCLLMPFGSAFAEQSKPLSVELLWQLKRIGSPVVSPSGEHIIAPVTEYDLKEDKGSTQLWRFDGEGKNNRAITVKGLKVSEPVFSPDGKTLIAESKLRIRSSACANARQVATVPRGRHVHPCQFAHRVPGRCPDLRVHQHTLG